MCRHVCIYGENSKCGELAVLISYQTSQTHFKSTLEILFVLCYSLITQCPLYAKYLELALLLEKRIMIA